jgi:hypothetical protein
MNSTLKSNKDLEREGSRPTVEKSQAERVANKQPTRLTLSPYLTSLMAANLDPILDPRSKKTIAFFYEHFRSLTTK